ncbi:hypothetical protein E2C01_036536 [Portunus trituberculatus]|uniref:Uncharacterized protein n=1 Tax=Portunus trituberculatus TaxID=210409 RepID=A0A5B7FCQ6_PORTR|nr:hypothetical protein [Portunus trituberculatus]
MGVRRVIAMTLKA